MELTFIFYIFAAFIIIPGTFFLLSLYGKYLAGGIASIGMIIIFILFGIQFFTPDGNYVQSSSPVSWPPTINFCPDFLSLMKVDASGGSTYVCVDTVGVSTNSSTGLQMFNPNNPITGGGVPAANQQFHLHLDVSNDNDRTNAIIHDCKTLGLTFEGVWDGITSTNSIVPRP
jgi:energy-coupling factor transporter transmembrane protein EcfT